MVTIMNGKFYVVMACSGNFSQYNVSDPDNTAIFIIMVHVQCHIHPTPRQ